MIKTDFKPEHFTGWFPPDVKPVYAGWYPIGRLEGCPATAIVKGYAYFDGKWWDWACEDPNHPRYPWSDTTSSIRIDPRYAQTATQFKWWRGLNFDPNALHL